MSKKSRKIPAHRAPLLIDKVHLRLAPFAVLILNPGEPAGLQSLPQLEN
jgi:hypothetical protein